VGQAQLLQRKDCQQHSEASQNVLPLPACGSRATTLIQYHALAAVHNQHHRWISLCNGHTASLVPELLDHLHASCHARMLGRSQCSSNPGSLGTASLLQVLCTELRTAANPSRTGASGNMFSMFTLVLMQRVISRSGSALCVHQEPGPPPSCKTGRQNAACGGTLSEA
jgi:hypothetical protein